MYVVSYFIFYFISQIYISQDNIQKQIDKFRKCEDKRLFFPDKNFFFVMYEENTMLKRAFIFIWEFYRDGFKSMTLGRTLWFLILIKLFIMFFILKIFFFSPYLKGKTIEEKQEYVSGELINRAN